MAVQGQHDCAQASRAAYLRPRPFPAEIEASPTPYCVVRGASCVKLGPAGAAHKEPRENKARVGLPMVAELVVEQDLPQCAAVVPRPRCRRPVVTVRVDRRQRGGPFIAGCAGGYARTTPRHAWACGAGRGLCTRPLGGRRAAARHLGSSSAGMQPGAPRASSARSPPFPSLGNGRQR